MRLFGLVFALMATIAPKPPPILRGIHRVVFIGDSITQAGDYVADIEGWCLSKGIRVQFIDAGLASETATDLTEAENAGHKHAFGFGRPFLSERLSRTLAATKPDLLVACYGMNDAGSLPPNDVGTKRFADAITRLRTEAMKAGVKRVLLCTPPVFDNKGPYAGNLPDQNLARYTEWLLSKRRDHWLIADIHTPMRRALDERRAADPNFAFAADGVHPNPAGHWVMAQAVLKDAFQANVDAIATPESMLPIHGDQIIKLVKQRQDLLFAAYMTKIGHQRPGVPGGPGATPGPSLEDAQRQAGEVDRQIDVLLKAR